MAPFVCPPGRAKPESLGDRWSRIYRQRAMDDSYNAAPTRLRRHFGLAGECYTGPDGCVRV